LGEIILFCSVYRYKNFRLFFDIVSAGLHAPFPVLYPLPYGGSELIFGDGGDDPLRPLLEGPSSQGGAPSSNFTISLLRRKIVGGD